MVIGGHGVSELQKVGKESSWNPPLGTDSFFSLLPTLTLAVTWTNKTKPNPSLDSFHVVIYLHMQFLTSILSIITFTHQPSLSTFPMLILVRTKNNVLLGS